MLSTYAHFRLGGGSNPPRFQIHMVGDLFRTSRLALQSTPLWTSISSGVPRPMLPSRMQRSSLVTLVSRILFLGLVTLLCFRAARTLCSPSCLQMSQGLPVEPPTPGGATSPSRSLPQPSLPPAKLVIPPARLNIMFVVTYSGHPPSQSESVPTPYLWRI